MKLSRFYFGALMAAMVLAAHAGLAQGTVDPTNTTDGKLGQLLSEELYCGGKGLIEGNLGLVIGLLIVFGALWSLAKGGRIGPAVFSILFGALVTALPSLIESSFQGIAQLMTDTGMSKQGTTFTPPACGNVRERIKAMQRREELENIKDAGMYM